MPRKRRYPKRKPPIPVGLAQITSQERGHWRLQGPLLEAEIDDDPLPSSITVWPDWATWAAFYASVRDQLFAHRPWIWERCVAERCFVAWQAGDDPEAIRDAILAERETNDPRRLFGVEHAA